MAKILQAIRGMNDIFPEEAAAWQELEARIRAIMHRYGYGEVRLPLLEHTDLFARAIGDVTDIVQKEMYTFLDRNGDSLTLRPEGTAGSVRAVLEHGRLRGQTPRLYYLGPMFRHERPQKGRYRQFHQVGVEAFGLAGPELDAEQIALCARMLAELDLTADLRINSLGSPESRAAYREALLQYLIPHAQDLCPDCQDRLHRNPLRVLDCKVEGCKAIASKAPQLIHHLDPDSAAHFDGLRRCLDGMGIPFTVNTRLVRGLDYYNRTVFEWVTDALGSQGTVIAGGRYDGLVAQLGGPPTPAVGFAAGLERLLALREVRGASVRPQVPDLFLGILEEALAPMVLNLGETLRSHHIAVVVGGPAGVKALLKQAERSQARYQALIGSAQAQGGPALVKEQVGIGQWQWPLADLPAEFGRMLGRSPQAGRPAGPTMAQGQDI